MLVATVFAFVATVLFMFILRPIAHEIGLVDHPGGRKRHGALIPLIGGVAMSVAIGLASTFVEMPPEFLPILLAVYLLVFVGTIDDRFDVPAGVRLVAQATAAMLIVFGAEIEVVSLEHAFFFEVGLGPFSGLFSLLFIITLINAFNVVDGLDGLAGGLSLTALISLALVGIGCNIWSLSVIAAAAVAGFLLFNLPLEVVRPLRSFMGDAGSTSLGLIIASIGMAVSQNPLCDVTPVVGLYLVAIPVFDLFSSAIRRVMEGRSPFAPDHEHLHHALVTHGLSQRATLLVMMLGAVLFAVIGLAAHFAEVEDGVLLLGWLAGLVLYYQAMRRPAWVVRYLERLTPTGVRRTRRS